MNRHLTRLNDAIATATENMSVQELQRRPAEDKWSTAQILEHLNLTYIATIKNFERSLRADKPLGAVPTPKDRIRIALVVVFGYFPPGREAPKGTVPENKLGQRVLAELEQNISTMDAVLQESETKFGKKTFVANHPVLGPLTVNQWRKFHWVHGRHHVKQILQLRKVPANSEFS